MVKNGEIFEADMYRRRNIFYYRGKRTENSKNGAIYSQSKVKPYWEGERILYNREGMRAGVFENEAEHFLCLPIIYL